MKYLLILSSFLLFFAACKEDESPLCDNCTLECLDGTEENVFTNDCKDNWECSFERFDASALSIDENGYTVIDGNKMVFVASVHTEGVIQIADDEFTYNLIFELESGLTSFKHEGTDLETINLQYQQVCFCENWRFNKVSMGCIHGQLLDDGTWIVQADVILMETDLQANFVIEATF